jgi:hypothetical protein
VCAYTFFGIICTLRSNTLGHSGASEQSQFFSAKLMSFRRCVVGE